MKYYFFNFSNKSSSFHIFIPNFIANANTQLEADVQTVNSVDTDFSFSDLIPQNQSTIIPEPIVDNLDYDLMEEENEPVVTNQYSLNDYRLFNKMLMDIKEYNHNNTVTIDKNLEYRLITKYSSETYHMFQDMLKIYSN